MLNKVLGYIGTPRMAVLAAGVYTLILLLVATCQGRPPQCTLPDRADVAKVWVVNGGHNYKSVTDLPARPPRATTKSKATTKPSSKKGVRGCGCSSGCTCGCQDGAPCTCGKPQVARTAPRVTGGYPWPSAPAVFLQGSCQPGAVPLGSVGCEPCCLNMPYRVAGTGFLSGAGAVGAPRTYPVRYANPLVASPPAMYRSPAPAFRPAPAMMGGGGGFGWSRGGGGGAGCST